MKKWRRHVISLVLLFFVFTIALAQEPAARAVAKTQPAPEPKATSSFDIQLAAYESSEAESSFPMAARETVRISFVYTPADATIEIGLVDEAGLFYYFTASNGMIQKTIQIEESGNYTLAVRNCSGEKVQISGYVEY